MSIGHFFHKLGDTLEQSTRAVAALPKNIVKDPKRIFTSPPDPLGTKITNKIWGTHYDPLVNQYGGPTKDTLNDVGANDWTRGGFKAADLIAAYYGGKGISSGLGNIGKGATAGVGSTGAADSELSEVTPGPNVTKVGTGSSVSNLFSSAGAKLPTTANGWLDLGGDALGLYSAYQQSRNASQIRKEANPFGQYRQMYGDQLAKLMADPNAFEDDPAYKFLRDQGLDAVTRKMASQGFTGSGNMAQELTKYAEGLASTYRDQELDRLGNFAGAGIAPASRSAATDAQNQAFNQFSDILASIAYGRTRDVQGSSSSGNFNDAALWDLYANYGA